MWTSRLAAIIAFCLAACLGAVQAQSLPAAAFAELPAVHYPSISPDGTRLAFSHNSGPDRYIVIMDLSTGGRTAVPAGDLRIEGVSWVGDRHVLVRAGAVSDITGIRGVVDTAQLVAINLETGNMRRLVRRLRGMGFNPDRAAVRAIDHDGERVLVEARTNQGIPNLYWINVSSGSNTVHTSGRRETMSWVFTPSFDVVARLDYEDEDTNILRVRRGNTFEPVASGDGVPGIAGVMGLDASGNNIIAVQDMDDIAASVVAIPLDGRGERTVLFEQADFELAGGTMDPYNRAVIGISWADNLRRTHWLDSDLEALQAQLDVTFEGEVVRIASFSRDRSSILIEVNFADRPVGYYLYRQTASGEVSLQALPSTNPAVAATPLPRREAISYLARDGVSIPGYLTLPEGAGPHPFVILPHGGPASRDHAGYDFLAHFLVSRGYGVMQPNFRGSAGYGREWREAGHGGWGLGIMQHDVTDAVEALVEAGIADPGRICIAGASYGGYAALAGAAFTPELYRCAISINGVSSLNRMMSYTLHRTGQGSGALQYWQRSMASGSDEPQQAYLAARSPHDNASAIRAAVLLIHGVDDSVVPVDQSRVMASALRQRGGTVRLVEQRGGDHWLTAYQTRREVLEEMESFLAEHLRP